MSLYSKYLTVVLFVLGFLWATDLRADLVNVAPQGTASQSTTGFGGNAARANDGNTNGVFGGGSITHSAADDPEPTWEVDLGETLPWCRSSSGTAPTVARIV